MHFRAGGTRGARGIERGAVTVLVIFRMIHIGSAQVRTSVYVHARWVVGAFLSAPIEKTWC